MYCIAEANFRTSLTTPMFLATLPGTTDRWIWPCPQCTPDNKHQWISAGEKWAHIYWPTLSLWKCPAYATVLCGSVCCSCGKGSRQKFRAQAACPGCQSESGEANTVFPLGTILMILLLNVPTCLCLLLHSYCRRWSACNLCPGVTRDKEFVTKLPPLGYFSPRGQIAVFQACISSCFYLAKNSLIVLCNSQTHSRRSTYQRDWGLDQASHSGDVWRSRKNLNIIMNLMSKYLQCTLPSSKRSTVENYGKTPLIASQGPRGRICRKW